MLKGLGGLGDMTKMMKAAKEMQDKMQKMQDDLATVTVIGKPVLVWSRPRPPPRAN